MPATGEPDPDLAAVEAIYDALDRGAPEEAWALARRELERGADDEPVLHFLAGVAAGELDDFEASLAALRRAVDLDPEDGEFRAHLALTLFRACRLDEAAEEAERAVRLDPSNPEAQHVRGLALERAGRFDAADAAFHAAARLDPESYAAPRRLSREAFEREVAAAGDRLPARFRRHLGEVAVTVEPLPSDAIVLEEEPGLDPAELLGLFVGAPLAERGAAGPGGELPPRILIFQRNLERSYPDRGELAREIARTLYHELGHYLGLDEEELAAIDLD